MAIENLISVIIPVYNIKINYLEDCIDSILSQTYNQFEIIIVDDGSNTECGRELDSIKEKDKRIYVFHKANEGVSVARNFGVSRSLGEYIVYADGDDILTPCYFENGMKCLKDNQADIVIGKVFNTTNRSACHSKRSKEVKSQILRKEDMIPFRRHIFSKSENDWGKDKDGALFNFEGCWAHIIKREVAERELFVPGITVGEDTIWALQLSENNKAYRICLVHDIWYLYIQNEGSVLHSYKATLPDVLTEANRIIFEEIKAEPEVANQYYDWVFVKLRQIVTNYLSKECCLNVPKKIKAYDKMMQQDIWHSVMCDKNIIPQKYKSKCFIFRSGLILIYFSLRTRGKESR